MTHSQIRIFLNCFIGHSEYKDLTLDELYQGILKEEHANGNREIDITVTGSIHSFIDEFRAKP